MATEDEQLPAYLTRGRRRAARRRFLAGSGSALATLASVPLLGAGGPRASAQDAGRDPVSDGRCERATKMSMRSARPTRRSTCRRTGAAPGGEPTSACGAAPAAPPSGRWRSSPCRRSRSTTPAGPPRADEQEAMALVADIYREHAGRPRFRGHRLPPPHRARGHGLRGPLLRWHELPRLRHLARGGLASGGGDRRARLQPQRRQRRHRRARGFHRGRHHRCRLVVVDRGRGAAARGQRARRREDVRLPQSGERPAAAGAQHRRPRRVDVDGVPGGRHRRLAPPAPDRMRPPWLPGSAAPGWLAST